MAEPVGDQGLDAVVAANQAFYDAHESRDLAAMAAVWDHGPQSVCVHPGWPILRGWPLIEESWRRIFAGPGRNQFTTGTVAATNTFVRTAAGWKLVLHHGSPVRDA
jgi:ketosteroid isomerase-like protein